MSELGALVWFARPALRAGCFRVAGRLLSRCGPATFALPVHLRPKTRTAIEMRMKMTKTAPPQPPTFTHHFETSLPWASTYVPSAFSSNVKVIPQWGHRSPAPM